MLPTSFNNSGTFYFNTKKDTNFFNKFTLYITFLTCFIMMFRFGFFAYYWMFLLGLLGWFKIFDKIKFTKTLIHIILGILSIHIISTLINISRLGFNYSWFLQVILFCGILFYFDNIRSILLLHFSKICRSLLYLLLVVIFIHIIIHFYLFSFPSFISLLTDIVSNADYFSSDRNMLSSTGENVLSIYKERIGLVFGACLILSWHVIDSRTRFIAIAISLFYSIIMSLRSFIAGELSVILLFLVMHGDTPYWRITKLSIFASLTAIATYVYFAQITEFLNSSGRYLFPVLTSPSFWNLPFGVGAGNFGTSISTGLWDQVCTLYAYKAMLSLVGFGLAYSPTGIYPFPESDVLLIAVSFGFIGLFMYIISILICLIKYCFIWNQSSEINYIGLYLLVYLVSGGIFQDWLSNQTSWIFYSISIIFLTYSKRLPCTSIGNDL